MHGPAQKKGIYRDILWPALLIVFLVICFVFTGRSLWQLSMNECHSEIQQATSRAVTALRHLLDLNRVHLELVVGLMAEDMAAGPGELEKRLELYCAHQHVDALCVQFPDGTLIRGGSDVPDFAFLPSFSEMRDAVPCISGRFPGVAGSGAYFLYQAVPIVIGGRVEAILYGLLNLEKLPAIFENSVPYDGASQLHILDGDTGDFLMNAHDSLGNLLDGGIGQRMPKSGYSPEIFLSDIANGRSGYYVFFSLAANEYCYVRYQPAGINNWSVQLTAFESVVFAKAKETRRILFILGGAVTAITVLFLVIVFLQYRQRLHHHNLEMRQTSFMFEIQQTLFDAHENPGLMEKALEKVGRTLEAEGVLLLSVRNGQVHRVSVWRDDSARFEESTEGKSLEREYPHVYAQMLKNRSILFYMDRGEQNFRFSREELDLMRLRKVRSMMLTPVLDAEGVLHGALCAVNLRKQWKTCGLLESVARIFMMAMCNMESYQIIHDMGTIDALTGMKNRNSYETDLPDYTELHDRIHCIYIDVNGLHELNNLKGHKAGDAMLQHTANSICSLFGKEHTYRIGGDEFVAFVLNDEDDNVTSRLAHLRTLMKEQGYAISVGVACRQNHESRIETTLARAENAMYQDKRVYYEKFDRRGRQR